MALTIVAEIRAVEVELAVACWVDPELVELDVGGAAVLAGCRADEQQQHSGHSFLQFKFHHSFGQPGERPGNHHQTTCRQQRQAGAGGRRRGAREGEVLAVHWWWGSLFAKVIGRIADFVYGAVEVHDFGHVRAGGGRKLHSSDRKDGYEYHVIDRDSETQWVSLSSCLERQGSKVGRS